MARPRLLLADDHQIVLEGLRRFLESDFDIAGAVTDGLALVEAAIELKPDVIVADITMPELNGIDAARRILNNEPGSRIVFLTMHPEVGYAIEALDAGALGYVVKTAAGELLRKAICEVLKGNMFVGPEFLSEAIRSRLGRPPQSKHNGHALLTDRQREIARLVAEGRTTKDIAALLHISARTVEFHKYRAIEALGLKSVAELIQYAIRNIA